LAERLEITVSVDAPDSSQHGEGSVGQGAEGIALREAISEGNDAAVSLDDEWGYKTVLNETADARWRRGLVRLAPFNI
jgi:hypothetical protein